MKSLLYAIKYLNSQGVDVLPYVKRINAIIKRDIGYLKKKRDNREPGLEKKQKVEKKLQDIFEKRLDDQLTQIRSKYKAAKPKLPIPENEDDYIGDLIDVLLSGIIDGIELFKEAIEIGYNFTRSNEYAEKWAKEYAYDLVTGIDETSADILSNAISGFVEGGDLGDIIDSISGQFGESRAEAIAVTETTRAFAEGQKEAAKELHEEFPDVEIHKTWFTNDDDIVCDDCGPLNGKEVPMNDEFDAGVDAPPYHVNCRCWVDYNTKLGTEKPTEEKQPEFIEAKTTKEAEQWARDNLGVANVDYGKLDVRVANEWNKAYFEAIKNYPELLKNIDMIGSAQARQRALTEIYKDIYIQKYRTVYTHYTDAEFDKIAQKWARSFAGKTSGNALAISFSKSKLNGIFVNETWKYDDLITVIQKDVTSGFHPIGCDTIKSVVDHEFGHQFDNMLTKTNDEISNIYRTMSRNNEIVSNVSGYAKTNRNEFIAESWSEYINNPAPRDTAKQIGDIISNAYKEKYGTD